MKTRRSERQATVDNLYEFLRWRIGADVVAITSERFLGDPEYMRLSTSERREALSMLASKEADMQAACANAREALAGRARFGAAEHARRY